MWVIYPLCWWRKIKVELTGTNIISEKEFLRMNSVTSVTTFHIAIYEGEGDEKMKTKCTNSSGDQNNKNCKCRIFEISQLYFHGPKFHSIQHTIRIDSQVLKKNKEKGIPPTNGRTRWWWLKPNSLPICRLNILYKDQC